MSSKQPTAAGRKLRALVSPKRSMAACCRLDQASVSALRSDRLATRWVRKCVSKRRGTNDWILGKNTGKTGSSCFALLRSDRFLNTRGLLRNIQLLMCKRITRQERLEHRRLVSAKQRPPATRVAGTAEGGWTPPRLVALCSFEDSCHLPADGGLRPPRLVKLPARKLAA